MVHMAKPLVKVKVGDLLKAEKINEIIERINNLERRLDQLEVKAPKRNTLKVNNPKRKTPNKKSPKTELLYHIDSVK